MANPNASTGTPYALPDLEALAESVPGLLVIDEAYVDFGGKTALPLLQRHGHVVILRTMSKAFGLAGVRLGYAFGAPDPIGALRKVQDSYPVDRLSQVAGMAPPWPTTTRRWPTAPRSPPGATAPPSSGSASGWPVWPSATNFLLVRTDPLPRPPEVLLAPTPRPTLEGLRRRRVLVRYFARPRLEGCPRISVGRRRRDGGSCWGPGGSGRVARLWRPGPAGLQGSFVVSLTCTVLCTSGCRVESAIREGRGHPQPCLAELKQSSAARYAGARHPRRG